MAKNDTCQTTRPRVLVVTASVGVGHNSAARAIIAALSEVSGDIEVQYLDVLTETPWLFRAYYAGGYALAVSWFQFFYGLGYRFTTVPRCLVAAGGRETASGWSGGR